MYQRLPDRTGDQSLVREINLSLIMNRLWEHSPISRAALAEMTGLNKSTVSSLINELIEHGFVREVGLLSHGIGRPSRQLELNPEAGFIVSAEVGVDFIAVLCANFAAEVIWQHREPTHGQADRQTIMSRAISLMQEAAARGRDPAVGRTAMLGLALGLPGMVEQTTGTLLLAPNLGWEDVPVCDLLTPEFPDVPVFVDNEANLAALGESFFGAAQGYHEILYVSAGVGVGGAMVSGGQIFRGTTGFAGEFGHMTIDPNGPVCGCGNRGCWETLVSPAALFRHIRDAAAQQSTRLEQMTGGNWDAFTVPLVVEAADAGDPVALEALAQVGRDLGIGIASLLNALNPDLVLLGGTLSQAHAHLLPVIRAEVARRALRWVVRAAAIERGQYGLNASLMGGVARVYQTILAQPGTISR
ncbi:ROK family transcriptional regulator [Aggregatilinea lenta]|uniref:ROK family transcriptional regulator n=1 Tax=Aggregatilinea lenta TaxID=913108 RepID=UPI000E5ADA23|nr:ROK family transcriptional regulator [Aggregatilinea lenta]